MADSPPEGIGGSSSSSVNDEIVRKELMKLSLWRVQPRSKPITSHAELEPILAKHGFYPGTLEQPHILYGAVSWKSYFYRGEQWMDKLRTVEEPPTVKLPYPNFDGHHELVCTAFLRALNFYLDLEVDDANLYSIFDIRGIDVNERELEDDDANWKIEGEPSEKLNPYLYKPTRILDRAAVKLRLNRFYGNA